MGDYKIEKPHLCWGHKCTKDHISGLKFMALICCPHVAMQGRFRQIWIQSYGYYIEQVERVWVESNTS